MPNREFYEKERDWWDNIASYLRNSPGMRDDLSMDAIKSNICGKVNSLANFCEHEADLCQKILDKMHGQEKNRPVKSS